MFVLQAVRETRRANPVAASVAGRGFMGKTWFGRDAYLTED
jgi:hypothetical protein